MCESVDAAAAHLASKYSTSSPSSVTRSSVHFDHLYFDNALDHDHAVPLIHTHTQSELRIGYFSYCMASLIALV